jgi:hypothetical protein
MVKILFYISNCVTVYIMLCEKYIVTLFKNLNDIL